MGFIRGTVVVMALRRFYFQANTPIDQHVTIDGELFHHICDVVRFSVGDSFELLPGDGRALLVEIEHIDRRALRARVKSQRVIAPLPKPTMTLCLSIPKLPKVDWIIEKSVELGVAEIRPFVSEFSFLRSVSEVSGNRVQRWQKLVQGATQQSGRGELMTIQPVTTLPNLLSEFNRTESAAGLFLYEGEARCEVGELPRGLGDAIGDLKGKSLDQVWVFVGSEGGFSHAEVKLFGEAELNPISLGDQILRVETACLALASIIKYEFGTLR